MKKYLQLKVRARIYFVKTQDSNSRLLYWTTSGVDKQGRLWRSQLDGEERTAVLSNLNWPTALAIDYERKLRPFLSSF